MERTREEPGWQESDRRALVGTATDSTTFAYASRRMASKLAERFSR